MTPSDRLAPSDRAIPSDRSGAADRRVEIAAAAAGLFRVHGYHATSLGEVCRALGVHKGSLFHFYPAKSDLLFAVYRATFAALAVRVAAIPAGLPADVELRRCVAAMLDTVAAHPDHVAVYFQERQWISRSLTPTQAATVRDEEAAFTGRLRAVVARGVAERVFRRVNVPLLVTALQATVQAAGRWPDPDLTPDLSIVDVIYAGIRPEKDPS